MELTIEDIEILLTWGRVIDDEYGNLSLEEVALQTKLQDILERMQKSPVRSAAEHKEQEP